jgi:hypothetical protein
VLARTAHTREHCASAGSSQLQGVLRRAFSQPTRLQPLRQAYSCTSWTTVIGMSPLPVMTGSGSELYRGPGAAMGGGLTLCLVRKLLPAPSIFSLFLQARVALRHARHVTEKSLASTKTSPRPTGLDAAAGSG